MSLRKVPSTPAITSTKTPPTINRTPPIDHKTPKGTPYADSKSAKNPLATLKSLLTKVIDEVQLLHPPQTPTTNASTSILTKFVRDAKTAITNLDVSDYEEDKYNGALTLLDILESKRADITKYNDSLDDNSDPAIIVNANENLTNPKYVIRRLIGGICDTLLDFHEDHKKENPINLLQKDKLKIAVELNNIKQIISDLKETYRIDNESKNQVRMTMARRGNQLEAAQREIELDEMVNKYKKYYQFISEQIRTLKPSQFKWNELHYLTDLKNAIRKMESLKADQHFKTATALGMTYGPNAFDQYKNINNHMRLFIRLNRLNKLGLVDEKNQESILEAIGSLTRQDFKRHYNVLKGKSKIPVSVDAREYSLSYLGVKPFTNHWTRSRVLMFSAAIALQNNTPDVPPTLSRVVSGDEPPPPPPSANSTPSGDPPPPPSSTASSPSVPPPPATSSPSSDAPPPPSTSSPSCNEQAPPPPTKGFGL